MTVREYAVKHAQTDAAAPESTERRPPRRLPVSPVTAILLAISFGLLAGYLDIGIILFKRFFWNPEGYYRIARDFPWSVPLAHAAFMLIPGLLVGALCWLMPRLVPLRAVSWLLATLAIWGALLRMPMYGACSLLLAAGLGRLVGDAVAGDGLDSRRLRWISAAFVGVLGVLAVGSSGWQVLRESKAVAALPAPRRKPAMSC